MRITRADLDQAIQNVNEKLKGMGSQYSYTASSRNGYTGVDLYRNGRCLHVIATGTPKECIGGLYSHAFDGLYEDACNRLREAAAEFTSEVK